VLVGVVVVVVGMIEVGVQVRLPCSWELKSVAVDLGDAEIRVEAESWSRLPWEFE
jgi:hypothetical protein